MDVVVLGQLPFGVGFALEEDVDLVDVEVLTPLVETFVGVQILQLLRVGGIHEHRYLALQLFVGEKATH